MTERQSLERIKDLRSNIQYEAQISQEQKDLIKNRKKRWMSLW